MVRECSPDLPVDEEGGVIEHREGYRISGGKPQATWECAVRAGSAGLLVGHDGNPYAFQLTGPI